MSTNLEDRRRKGSSRIAAGGLNDGAGVGWFSQIIYEDIQILREECVH